MTADYYSDSTGNYPYLFSVPTFNFVKKESFGYSLNGMEFLVGSGEPYTVVQDKFHGTAARIIDGTNLYEATDGNGRTFTKAVNTGWTDKTVDRRFVSDMLSLWGMSGFGTDETEPYVLSMNHDNRKDIHEGNVAVAALDKDGNWVNAVTLNIGAGNVPRAMPVIGAYDPAQHVLGDWGYDPKTKTVWAKLNYNADFVVMKLEYLK